MPRPRPTLVAAALPTAALLITAALLAACSSSSSSSDQEYSFRDAKGRQCKNKSFPPTATCDSPAAPMNGCGAGSTPCFVVATGQLRGADGGVSGPTLVRNCDGCCKEGANSSTTTTADCVPVVCTAPADCAGETRASCVDGRCQVER